MRHIIFTPNPDNKYKVAVLIKQTSFDSKHIRIHYIDPLVKLGLQEQDIIALSLKYDEKGKAPVKLIKSHLETVLKACKQLGISTLLVADGSYFKKLTDVGKAEPYHGYIKPNTFTDQKIDVILSINYQSLFYKPELQNRLDLSLSTTVNSLDGFSIEIGSDIIHSDYYPDSTKDIQEALKSLHQYDALTCDIEGFSLKHYNSGIGTIAFAWDQHNGIAFKVDYSPLSEPIEDMYGFNYYNAEVRELLKKFFTEYQGKLIYHNITYDAYILTYQLWMSHILDLEGLYTGLDIMTKNFDCTQIITYLATNSCSGNTLSLKYNAQEFAGNYAQDNITDIRRIPENNLLKYNLTDCLATWYVHNKNYPVMVMDQQEEVYQSLFKETLITIIQMQLTGFPMSMDRVLEVEKELELIDATNRQLIENSSLVNDVTGLLKQIFLDKDFKTRKDKAKNPDKIKPKLIQDIVLEFNPGSSKQVATLLHDVMNLPVIDTTDKGFPSTDEKTLTALIEHTDNDEYKELITNILDLGKVAKILTTFIPAFKNAQLGNDGIHYLFGSYNAAGTISSRLSSSNPNLQNLPSGSLYGKLIKSCFIGNHNFIFAGADFASLEDRINALLTRDPNKLKVYLENYDGHSLRTYYYWPHKFKHLTDSAVDINSIAKKYPKDRSASKTVTFALTFAGTWITLVKNSGFSEKEAKAIETNYHELYEVSDKWVYDKLKQASIDGYVTLAFGIRLRTPILKQVIWDSPKMPYEASAEGRSAGNAVSGQSFGQLNCRAANELRQRIRNSPYKYKIRISGQIHDSIYCIIANEVGIAEWLNNNLIECMEWQGLDSIKHNTVHMESELELYYKGWNKPIELPNKVNQQEIIDICKR